MNIIQRRINLSTFINIEKAYQEGIYSDNSTNRKLGRVGLTYAQYDKLISKDTVEATTPIVSQPNLTDRDRVISTEQNIELENPITFKPSKYQQAIFDFTIKGKGNAVINAVAGSGKTTTIINVLKLLPKSELQDSIFLAFNKSIVAELTEKVPQGVMVKTLHGLGMSDIMQKHKNVVVNNSKMYFMVKDKAIEENWEDTIIGLNEESGSEYSVKDIKSNIETLVGLGKMNLATSKEDIIEIANRHNIDLISTDFEPDKVIKLMRESYLKRDKIDFNDMIYIAATDPTIKPRTSLRLFIDECQDLNAAQQALFLKHLDPVKGRFIAVGDPSQCQPEGTKVLMSEDLIQKNIEDLIIGDKVVSFNSKGSNFRGLTDKRYSAEVLEINKRKVNENIIKIITETGKSSSYSDRHICLATISREAGKYQALYLMEGENGVFRIGVCRLLYSSGVGISNRVRSEGGKKAWLLDVFEDKNEAFLKEQYYSIKYQIPDIIFKRDSTGTNNTYTQEQLTKLWSDFYNIINLREKAELLLQEFGRDYSYPIYENLSGKSKQSIGTGVITEVRACNLISKIFDVICLGEDRYEEEKFINRKINPTNRDNRYEKIINLERYYYEGYLYSLKVSDNETYIADGISTHNCIYGFAGADLNAFNNLKNLPNTQTLPLSVNYRCGKNIVALAKEIVPHLEASDGAKDGEVNLNSSFLKIQDGDMVLCRNNAPLVKMCMQFLGLGQKAYVKGGDIGKGLVTLINSLNKDKIPEINTALKQKYDQIINNLVVNKKIDIKKAIESDQARNFAEKISIINIFQENSYVKDKKSLINALEFVFKDESKEGICFSSIHKSKGLESKNVHIIEKHRMPSKFATQPWEKEQEENLRYVAYTRAKESLNFISDWSFGSKNEPGTTLEEMKDKYKRK